jgi:23S rRNA (uracil1939-C5)-methyltransferase
VTRSSKLAFTNLLVKQLTEEFPALCGIIQNINRDRGNIILGEADKLLFGTPYLTEELSGVLFRIHYRSFWQINSSTLSLITETLRSFLSPQDTVFDAYAGIGSLGLPLAKSVRQVLCIEESKAAIADGEENARLNDIANAGFLCAKVEDALPALLKTDDTGATKAPDVIILDPPRSGILPEALSAIITARIPRIFYLSCSPMTLNRDLKILLDSGVYSLQFIQPYDMFPQTWHIETLAILELRPGVTPEN